MAAVCAASSVSRPAVASRPRTASAAAIRCSAAEQPAAAAAALAAPALGRRSLLGAGLALGAAAAAQPTLPAQANRPLSAEWEVVDLPIDKDVLLLDVAFTGTDPNHGFLLGSRQTLLETFDGGKTWEPRTVDAARDEGFNFRFNSISFNGDEGWIVGKPAILLHTTDGGKSWERMPLSAKLPGAPVLVTALDGPGCAEMTTDQGAIYVTSNGAMNWTAAVQETVDATLNRVISSGISGASYYEGSFSNVSRNADGDYVAVSSRGNFFMTWTAGQTYWRPHNRPSTRRLQNMGYTPDNKIWLTCKGGDVYYVDASGEGAFAPAKINSRGFGILDIKFVDDKLGYACGGSGSLFKTEDGGQSWKRERAADTLAANLYELLFTPAGLGFVLGNDGVLLRRIVQA
ncbi:Photosystem II stability assembly factor chloroplastic [Micractinium conductrix]|uniref:Photosystem II stability/assembly factor n=1 Tax=Micractinium conductrix TaxID=554055 RepID=A0A2P6V919_9CHLO|nr:Photosystem II stability assembly factor chloroplastic [Micractinium conductrix]|eukprot:PSC70590.1 Photosystem II stability assembly factor chloroplastic [Micractinium conductrix]